jgi:hypothetical protein
MKYIIIIMLIFIKCIIFMVKMDLLVYIRYLMILEGCRQLLRGSACAASPLYFFCRAYESAVSDPADSNSKATLIKLSSSFQNALMATYVINLINDAEPPTTIFAPSLRDKIINFRPSIDGYEFDEDMLREFLKIFTDGLMLSKAFKQPIAK